MVLEIITCLLFFHDLFQINSNLILVKHRIFVPKWLYSLSINLNIIIYSYICLSNKPNKIVLRLLLYITYLLKNLSGKWGKHRVLYVNTHRPCLVFCVLPSGLESLTPVRSFQPEALSVVFLTRQVLSQQILSVFLSFASIFEG